MRNENDLELDFSSVDGVDSNTGSNDSSGLELDYSGVEDGKEEPTEGSENESTQQEATEDSKGEAEDDASKNTNSEEATESSNTEANEGESKENSETDKDEKNESNQEQESEEADTLSEIDTLIAELENDSNKTDEIINKADEAISNLGTDGQAGEAGGLLEELKVDNAQNKTTIDQLNKLIQKLNKEKGEVMMRNTELELYGNVDDPSLMYLNGNIDKAKAGDDRSKRRIVSILDDLRNELVGSTLEEDNINRNSDLISKVSSLNSSSNPNTTTDGGLDNYEINL